MEITLFNNQLTGFTEQDLISIKSGKSKNYIISVYCGTMDDNKITMDHVCSFLSQKTGLLIRHDCVIIEQLSKEIPGIGGSKFITFQIYWE